MSEARTETTAPPAAATAAAAAAGANGAAAPWYDTLQPDERGFIVNKGWDKLEPAAATQASIRAYREVEKLRGIPADEIARIPKDPNDESGWTALHQRLGMPATKDGYDFAALKFSDGTELDPAFVDTMRQAAFSARLGATAAQAMVGQFMRFLEETEKQEATNTAFNATAEIEKLKSNWGPHFETNSFVARRAAEVLGIPAEAIAALEKVGDYATVMETMRKLGVAMGEARYITGEAPGQTGPMSADQAAARKTELMADQGFRLRVANGDAAAIRELNQIDEILVRARMR